MHARALRGQDNVVRAVLLAAAAALLLEFALQALAGNLVPGKIVGTLIGYPLALGFFWLVGWWLGTRTWPRRGGKLARAVLRRQAKDKRALVFLSDRPDIKTSVTRRVWEVVGFSAGASVLYGALLLAIGPNAGVLAGLAPILPALTLWAAFILVPYWLTARLGLRVVDPMRWLVLPYSRRYANRWRLSNGALVLLGTGALFNVLFRTGQDSVDALVGALVFTLRIVAAILVVAAAAVAYYTRDERALVHQLEIEAIEMGLRDGRGMSDGDFLPRLPPPKA